VSGVRTPAPVQIVHYPLPNELSSWGRGVDTITFNTKTPYDTLYLLKLYTIFTIVLLLLFGKF